MGKDTSFQDIKFSTFYISIDSLDSLYLDLNYFYYSNDCKKIFLGSSSAEIDYVVLRCEFIKDRLHIVFLSNTLIPSKQNNIFYYALMNVDGEWKVYHIEIEEVDRRYSLTDKLDFPFLFFSRKQHENTFEASQAYLLRQFYMHSEALKNSYRDNSHLKLNLPNCFISK